MIGNLSKHKRNNDDTYRRSEIDLIVSNAKKSAVKYAEELAEKKLDKDENKGLSANDYTDSDKAEVAKVKDKVDKVSGKGLSANDYTNAEKAEVAKVKDKVDKVSGKGLSTNDFTSAYKTKLDNLDTNLNTKVDKVTGKGLSKNDFTDDYKAKLDNLNTNISETLAGKADKTEVLTKTNTTAFTPTADYQPATKKYVDDLASNKGGGDMLKSAYDANKDGVVNDSDKLGGQLPSYYAQASDLTNKVDKVSGKGLSANDFTSAYKTKLDNLDANLNNKVDKVSGKGLSANDFTDNYKTKLDNLDTNLNNKVDKVSGKGLSTNDFTADDKNEVAKIKDKVDKATGKGLSANDYTDSDKAEVAKVKDKVDKVTGKGLSSNDYTSEEKAEVAKIKDKVDKVTGKGLSTNDYTSDDKAKVDSALSLGVNNCSNKLIDLQTDKASSANAPKGIRLAPNGDDADNMGAAFIEVGSQRNLSSTYLATIGPNYVRLEMGEQEAYVSPEDIQLKTGSTVNHSLIKKANSSDVLTKTNTTAFTPTADYQPATKKYVDDLATGGTGVSVVDNLTSTSTTSALSANQGKILNDKVKALPIRSLAGGTAYIDNDTAADLGEGATIIGDLDWSGRGSNDFDGYGHATVGNVASGTYSIAAGSRNTARGDYSVTMGARNDTRGFGAIAMGYCNTANGNYSVAMGDANSATGLKSVAMSGSCKASGDYSVAMGGSCEASGKWSVALGGGTAKGMGSVALGAGRAQGSYSFSVAMGGSYALDYQSKIGQYPSNGQAGSGGSTTGDAFIIGNGVDLANLSNAFRVTYAGKAYGLSAYGSSGADYAEYFEWSDGNPDDEDRRGRLVTLDGEKIRFATADDDYILGIISANPCVEGDIQPDDWQGKYLTDVFGQRVTKTVHIPDRYEEHETIDPETGETKTESILIEKEHDAVQWVLNPDYDPEQEYVSREDRKEWAPVGMMGKLVVIDDGTCEVNGFCKAGENGIATKANDGYRVMSRIDDTHLRVLVK